MPRGLLLGLGLLRLGLLRLGLLGLGLLWGPTLRLLRLRRLLGPLSRLGRRLWPGLCPLRGLGLLRLGLGLWLPRGLRRLGLCLPRSLGLFRLLGLGLWLRLRRPLGLLSARRLPLGSCSLRSRGLLPLLRLGLPRPLRL